MTQASPLAVTRPLAPAHAARQKGWPFFLLASSVVALYGGTAHAAQHHKKTAHSTPHAHTTEHTSTHRHAAPHSQTLTTPASNSSSKARSQTAAERQAEQSVQHARDALQTTQAQRDAVNRQKAAQAAAVEASRAKNEAAQAMAAQKAATATALSAATVTATSQLQSTEQQISDLDTRVADIRSEQASLRAALQEGGKALAPVLPLAERLSLYPSDTLLAAPVPQGEAVTGFLVLKGLSRELERKAEEMRTRQEKLSALDTELSTHLTQLGSLQHTQALQRDNVRQQALKAKDAQRQANLAAKTAAQRLQEATSKAASLQDAVARLDSLQADAEAALQKEIAAAERAHQTARDEAARRAAAARAEAARRKMAALQNTAGPGLSTHGAANNAGNTHSSTQQDNDTAVGNGPSSGVRPVAGRLVSTWGAQTETGPASGLTYSTPPGASVRTPCSGRVDFAGAFRTYGQMVILNCGQHYRFIMAGLGGLDVETGQSLTKGAPMGHMGASGTLFIQLRRGQKAINPAPFL
ncbi:murein hydrolase activator EnvC [Acetobacter orientalis]|uniref:murein hydrolase activator EnvC family protein n=1 Tax=Acetobacter orientalis TaxID=146474 RepID=UPI0024202778|nr:peptidoglycan DD-metalloendopeptidase family protein [Acetobacter orientalis]